MLDDALPAGACERIAVARGERPADLALRGGEVLNVMTGERLRVDLVVAGGVVAALGDGYEAEQEIDCTSQVICPGLMDAHLHLESSQVTLAQFARAVLPRGTTAVVLDPHEIANVHGLEGVRYLLRSREGLPLNAFIMAPSCVPATDMETAGARLTAEDLETLYAEEGVLGLAEMMNFPGVLHCDPQALDKVARARARGLVVDGHAPGLTGRDLSAYVAAGVDSEHECTRPEEALEKLRMGVHVFIREGSGARNLADLVPVVSERNSRRCCFCADDRHPDDLLAEGHMDNCVRRAVADGLDPLLAVQMATLNPAERFGLDRLGYGALTPGRRADIVVVDDLAAFGVRRTYVAGRLVAQDGEMVVPLPEAPCALPQSMNIAWERMRGLDIPAPANKRRVRVIEVTDGQVLTGHGIAEAAIVGGRAVADVRRDMLKLAVIERHHGTGNVGLGFVRGFGLKRGALASSIAHDAHNIVVVGASDEDMMAAGRAVAAAGGGQAAVADGEVIALLELPIAGLMSDRPVARVAREGEAVAAAARTLGCRLSAPLMTLSFLALPVIPALKLTDKGLVDVDAFDFVDLWAD